MVSNIHITASCPMHAPPGNDVGGCFISYVYVTTRAGHADSAYAVSCGYVHMRLGFPNLHKFYVVSCGYALI